ncbi:MAG: glycerophosphodiester phosphodiesterase [Fimbriimonas sp.]
MDLLLENLAAIKVPQPAKRPYSALKMNVRHLVLASWKTPQVVGHRGAAAHVPENTLASFEEAIAAGCDLVECDVHLSADGQVVVIHDPTVDRTTSLSGPVSSFTAEALAAVGVPSLDELLALTKERIPLIIEIKDGDGHRSPCYRPSYRLEHDPAGGHLQLRRRTYSTG